MLEVLFKVSNVNSFRGFRLCTYFAFWSCVQRVRHHQHITNLIAEFHKLSIEILFSIHGVFSYSLTQQSDMYVPWAKCLYTDIIGHVPNVRAKSAVLQCGWMRILYVSYKSINVSIFKKFKCCLQCWLFLGAQHFLCYL